MFFEEGILYIHLKVRLYPQFQKVSKNASVEP
jgi:hypothetical protein